MKFLIWIILLFSAVITTSNPALAIHPLSNTTTDPELVTLEEVADYSSEELE